MRAAQRSVGLGLASVSPRFGHFAAEETGSLVAALAWPIRAEIELEISEANGAISAVT